MRPTTKMTFVPMALVAATLMLVSPSASAATTIPGSTDEARALAARALATGCDAETSPLHGDAVVSSTDVARSLAGQVLAARGPRPSPQLVPVVVSSTDEARAAAGRALGATDCGAALAIAG